MYHFQNDITEDAFKKLYNCIGHFYHMSDNNIINEIPNEFQLKKFAINTRTKGKSVFQYLVAEIIDLALGCDFDNNNILTPLCINRAVKYDNKLNKI